MRTEQRRAILFAQVGGYDKSGGHLFYNCPSGNYYEYKAFAIGARSQASPPSVVCADVC